MRGTTIARVAAEAGVGVGTVSRVLNGSPSVREDTRRKVLDAIATLDYQPSPTARALSTGRTHAIGVVAPFFTQPSVIERLRGVSRTLTQRGLPADPARRGAPGPAPRDLPCVRRARTDRRAAGDLARADRGRGEAAGARRGADRAARPRTRQVSVHHDRRRRGRPAGGRAPARARPPADRVRGRRGGEPVRVRLQRPAARGLRGGARRRGRAARARVDAAPAARPRRSARRGRRGAALSSRVRRPSSRPPTSRRSESWRRPRPPACRFPRSSR